MQITYLLKDLCSKRHLDLQVGETVLGSAVIATALVRADELAVSAVAVTVIAFQVGEAEVLAEDGTKEGPSD